MVAVPRRVRPVIVHPPQRNPAEAVIVRLVDFSGRQSTLVDCGLVDEAAKFINVCGIQPLPISALSLVFARDIVLPEPWTLSSPFM